MIRGGDEIARLQRIVDELQKEWYGAGRGADFERHVACYQARGEWPFAEVAGRAEAPAAP
jgi:hypothetical protein